jgi:hypothetical protein
MDLVQIIEFFDFRNMKSLRIKTKTFDAHGMLHTKQVKKFSSEKVIFLLKMAKTPLHSKNLPTPTPHPMVKNPLNPTPHPMVKNPHPPPPCFGGEIHLRGRWGGGLVVLPLILLYSFGA